MVAPNPIPPLADAPPPVEAPEDTAPRRRKLVDLFRRPLGRLVVLLAIALLLYFLAKGAPPQASVAIVNDTADVLTGVELTLDEGEGRVRVERIEELAPETRLEFTSAARSVKVDLLTFERGANVERYADVGKVPAGEQLTLTVKLDGRLDREQLFLPQ